MHDLHSNSGAIKLNQTGGMLKHLRTGSSTIDNMHCGLGSQQRSLESQRSMAPGPNPSQLKAGAIIQAFCFSDPVPLFLVYTAFYFSDPVPSFLVQDHFSYK